MSAVKTSALETYAAQLKAWRKKRGWSQGDLAVRLRYSDSLISGIETTARSPTLEFARQCDKAFDAPETFVALHGMVSREAWPSYFAPVIDFEKQAVRIHEWEMRVVPGLLQTEDYARSVICAGTPRITPVELDRKVTSRLERQRIFARVKPPMYWTVLHEGTLRQMIGSPSIMAEQLDKIIAAAKTPDIVVQIFPFTVSDHPGTNGPMKIFDLTDNTSVAYMECDGGGMITEGPEAVAEKMATLNMIRVAALPPKESMSLLQQIRSEIANE